MLRLCSPRATTPTITIASCTISSTVGAGLASISLWLLDLEIRTAVGSSRSGRPCNLPVCRIGLSCGKMAVQLSTRATVAWPLLLRRPVLAGPRRSTVARSSTIASWQLSGRRPCTLGPSSEASRAIASNSTISSRIAWRSGRNVRPSTSQLLDCLGLRWSCRVDRLGLSRLSWSRLNLGRLFLSSWLFFFNGFCRRLFFSRFSSLLTF